MGNNAKDNTLGWIEKDFISRKLYAPFIIEKDNEYISHLKGVFSHLYNQAKSAKADQRSLDIIKTYTGSIIEAIDSYYHADIETTYKIVKELVEDIGEDELAVSELKSSRAFPGDKSSELQLFRARRGDPTKAFSAEEMLYLPFSKRAKTGNYRFSIPGNPCFYLANSSYGCWIEIDCPPENEFNVSPVLLDGIQKIFNLAVSIRDHFEIRDYKESRVHTWLKLLILMIATSYRIKEEERTFKSEYIISQSIMIACKKMGYDGVAYYSKKVSDEAFAFCAINLALFVDYNEVDSGIVKHIKIDDSFNYSIFNNLLPSEKQVDYELRSVKNGLITNLGNYIRQFPYTATEFSIFDRFLFSNRKERELDI